MGKETGRGKNPSRLTLRILCANAAGRCQFEGCNKPVFVDVLTLKQFNMSNVAHIVASDPNGPRGDAVRSHQLSDKLENLMLMCADHHKLIDADENVKEFPEDRLLQMKARHEQLIALQCDLIYKEPSEMVFLQSPIKGYLPAKIDAHQCAEAVMPSKRVISIRGQRIAVEVEGNYRSTSYWESALKVLERKFILKVSAILEEEANAHFSVFPIAPIPLIIKLGYMMGDKHRADIFQFSRDRDSWKWCSQELTNSFTVKKQLIRDGVRVALVISLTDDIALSRVTDVYDADVLYIIRANHFGEDCIKSPEDLSAFWHVYQSSCNDIKNKYPQVSEIGVFPAMPVSAAFEVGRRYMPGVYPSFRIFDEDNGFFETIMIGGKSND